MPATTAKTPPVRRGFHFAQFKALDEQRGTFSGYLAVFNNEDHGGDIIEPGAFAKTLVELKTRQQGRQSRFILPIFWSHNPDDPIGGFTCAREDTHGLYVEGELDLDIEQGRRAYSGMVKGYCDGMSIGYFSIKADYDRLGRRHLKELALFEGSITPIPMNPDATIGEVKTATGKTSWPLADRDAAWDGGAAHKRIVAWATDDSGIVNTGKLKSVHFYSPDGDAAENVSEYKLLFCDVDGDGNTVQAIPRGIFACAGSHGVDATTGISADEQDAIRAKITSYYKRMAKQFDDDTIKAPWDDDGKKGTRSMNRARQGQRRPAHLPQGKASDFTSTLTGMLQGDTLQREWAKTFDAFVMCIWNGLIDAKYPSLVATADGTLAPDDSDPQDALDANVDAFADAVKDLIKRSIAADFYPHLDDDADSFADPDDADDSEYMSRDTSGAEQKRGAVMSAANHKALGGMIADMKKSMTALAATHKALTAFHGKMQPGQSNGGDTEPGAGDSDTTQSGDTGTNGTNGNTGKALDTGTGTHTGAGRAESDTTPLTADQISTLIRDRMLAARLAANVARVSA